MDELMRPNSPNLLKFFSGRGRLRVAVGLGGLAVGTAVMAAAGLPVVPEGLLLKNDAKHPLEVIEVSETYLGEAALELQKPMLEGQGGRCTISLDPEPIGVMTTLHPTTSCDGKGLTALQLAYEPEPHIPGLSLKF
ncbi:hypothetical protein [Salipiger sp. PrR003]|uniref:hypothetical protein n=1 Tax=Salipiger sp. PrR003 TaxID=2706776 RepID=UPI0013DD2532|nr:hypothetical protein [Salipiger sp. PrR003]NDV50350.1 hypothetical protein [Salipiger sp. PrR003]